MEKIKAAEGKTQLKAFLGGKDVFISSHSAFQPEWVLTGNECLLLVQLDSDKLLLAVFYENHN